MTRILIATATEVLAADLGTGTLNPAPGLGPPRPTCLATDPTVAGRVWCGTDRDGVYRSDDAGEGWIASGLRNERITSLAASPTEEDVVWAGTEPSRIWRSHDGGVHWERTQSLDPLPSSAEWSFPPKPETHHVRWIACHPHQPKHLWVAIEAGALISTVDGGASWRDRVSGGPYDTHELAIHPKAPNTLRVSAGDGYFESTDGGATWATPRSGLEVGYLRSVVIDPGRPDTVLVSASSRPRTAYVAGVSDGRVYRRADQGSWERVIDGWPNPPNTIAPLLLAGRVAGELWAADERGLHRSDDGGRRWLHLASFSRTPNHLRGITLVG